MSYFGKKRTRIQLVGQKMKEAVKKKVSRKKVAATKRKERSKARSDR